MYYNLYSLVHIIQTYYIPIPSILVCAQLASTSYSYWRSHLTAECWHAIVLLQLSGTFRIRTHSLFPIISTSEIASFFSTLFLPIWPDRIYTENSMAVEWVALYFNFTWSDKILVGPWIALDKEAVHCLVDYFHTFITASVNHLEGKYWKGIPWMLLFF